MECKYCGKEYTKDMKFCPNCGKKINYEDEIDIVDNIDAYEITDYDFEIPPKRNSLKTYIAILIILILCIIIAICVTDTDRQLIEFGEPEGGQLFVGDIDPNGNELTIITPDDRSYVVQIKDINGNIEQCFFAAAGEITTTIVSKGYYYVSFASGNKWYGEEHLFGKNTSYIKDDKGLDFRKDGATCTYTLSPVKDGNFKGVPIDESEFKW